MRAAYYRRVRYEADVQAMAIWGLLSGVEPLLAESQVKNMQEQRLKSSDAIYAQAGVLIS